MFRVILQTSQWKHPLCQFWKQHTQTQNHTQNTDQHRNVVAVCVHVKAADFSKFTSVDLLLLEGFAWIPQFLINLCSCSLLPHRLFHFQILGEMFIEILKITPRALFKDQTTSKGFCWFLRFTSTPSNSAEDEDWRGFLKEPHWTCAFWQLLWGINKKCCTPPPTHRLTPEPNAAFLSYRLLFPLWICV